MNQYTPFEYLLIDIANHYGLDKELFETRIQWVKDNRYNLEALSTQADDPALYVKSVLALRDVEAGRPTGHMISLDAVNSGIQVLSALTNCIKGCKATGLADTGSRPDAYGAVMEAMNHLLQEDGLEGFSVSRAQAKQAVMTACYGSTATPKKLFGEDFVEYFNEACLVVAKGAFSLMPVLIDSWDSNALAHEWTMVDGFEVFIPILETKTTTIRVDELGGAGIAFQYKANQTAQYGLANAANFTHALDGLVMRNMVRRCSYDKDILQPIKELLELHILKCSIGYAPILKSRRMTRLVELALANKFFDPVFFNYLDENNVKELPIEVATKLNELAAKMLAQPSFHLITVHDAFKCLPTYGNTVRYWYAEIMAEIAESDMLQQLLQQLYKRTKSFRKGACIADKIRQSNYGLS